MPVPLEECFPVNKVAQIAVRQHEVKLKQQKNLRKSLSTPKTVGIPQIKPMESINDPLIRKRLSDQHVQGSATKRSRSSADFDHVFVETTNLPQ